MIKVHDKDTGTWIGSITEENLQFLISQLEEESSEPRYRWWRFSTPTRKVSYGPSAV